MEAFLGGVEAQITLTPTLSSPLPAMRANPRMRRVGKDLTRLSPRGTAHSVPNPRLSVRLDPQVIDRIERCVIAENALRPANPIERGGMVRILLLSALPNQEAKYADKRRRRVKKGPKQ